MKRRREHPERAAAVLSRVLRAAPRRPGPDAPGSGSTSQARPSRVADALALTFRRAVGDAIAAHARPVRFKNGVLVLAVDAGVWLTELGFMRDDIARKVSAEIGDVVSRVDLRAERRSPPPALPAANEGARERRAPAEAVDEPPPALGVAEREACEALASGLAAEPDLHDAVLRAAARWRAARRRG